MRSVINLCLWSLMHLCLLSLRAHLLYQWSPLCSWISVICLHCNLSDQIMHRRTGERRASRVIKIINITLQREQDEDITAIEWYLMMIFKLKQQKHSSILESFFIKMIFIDLKVSQSKLVQCCSLIGQEPLVKPGLNQSELHTFHASVQTWQLSHLQTKYFTDWWNIMTKCEVVIF